MQLPVGLHEAHRVRSVVVRVPRSSGCFGPWAEALAFELGVGYDTVAGWAFHRLAGPSGGFVLSGQTGELRAVRGRHRGTGAHLKSAQGGLSCSDSEPRSGQNSWTGIPAALAGKAGGAVACVFLFYALSTIVAFTLRDTQRRMMRFTALLQRTMRRREPIALLCAAHIWRTLVNIPLIVGTLFFLAGTFTDQTIAFFVQSIVWEAEVFSIVCVRTPASVVYFPRIFLGYFTLFCLYFFAFPDGFTHTAALCTFVFVQHIILHLWNAYEAPALIASEASALPASDESISAVETSEARAPSEVAGGGLAPTTAGVENLAEAGTAGRVLAEDSQADRASSAFAEWRSGVHREGISGPRRALVGDLGNSGRNGRQSPSDYVAAMGLRVKHGGRLRSRHRPRGISIDGDEL